MLNIIWPIMLIVSFIYAIFLGRLPEINNAIFESVEKATTLTITLIGTMCLWSGMMKIAMETSLVEKIKKILNPALNFLFPNIDKKNKAYNNICLNIIANMLGLGNAATPLGLEAIEKLQEQNNKKNTLSNSMAMLIVINTASIQIIPTTVIAIRNSLKSTNPTGMILPVWIATACATIGAVLSAKIIMKINLKKIK